MSSLDVIELIGYIGSTGVRVQGVFQKWSIYVNLVYWLLIRIFNLIPMILRHLTYCFNYIYLNSTFYE